MDDNIGTGVCSCIIAVESIHITKSGWMNRGSVFGSECIFYLYKDTGRLIRLRGLKELNEWICNNSNAVLFSNFYIPAIKVWESQRICILSPVMLFESDKFVLDSLDSSMKVIEFHGVKGEVEGDVFIENFKKAFLTYTKSSQVFKANSIMGREDRGRYSTDEVEVFVNKHKGEKFNMQGVELPVNHVIDNSDMQIITLSDPAVAKLTGTSKISWEENEKINKQRKEEKYSNDLLETLNKLNSADTEEEAIEKKEEKKGLDGCTICNGYGVYEDEYGNVLQCSCVLKKDEAIKKVADNVNMFKMGHNLCDAESAVANGLIPEHRKADIFNEKRVKEVATKVGQVLQVSYVNGSFTKYLAELDNISARIRNNIKLGGSYMIYAPNGFGKTTFANECIKTLFAQEKKCVPYTSLIALARERKKYIERKELFGSGGSKKANTYNWMDYIDASVVFLFVDTDMLVENKQVWGLLSTILEERRKPTIIFTEVPLNTRESGNQQLLNFILNNLSVDDSLWGTDKVKYVGIETIRR